MLRLVSTEIRSVKGSRTWTYRVSEEHLEILWSFQEIKPVFSLFQWNVSLCSLLDIYSHLFSSFDQTFWSNVQFHSFTELFLFSCYRDWTSLDNVNKSHLILTVCSSPVHLPAHEVKINICPSFRTGVISVFSLLLCGSMFWTYSLMVLQILDQDSPSTSDPLTSLTHPLPVNHLSTLVSGPNPL